MKKFGIIVILLLVLTAGGITAAHALINGQEHVITITETTLSGDKRAADGITVKAKYEDAWGSINWWTTYSTTEGQVLECKTNLHEDEEENTEKDYVYFLSEYLGYGVDDPEDTETVAKIGEAHTGIPASEILEKINQAESGKRTQYTYQLDDYMDFFPVDLRSSKGKIHYNTMPGDLSYIKDYPYFQIPVPKGLNGTLSVTKDKDGDLKKWNMYINSNQFVAEGQGVVSDGKLFLATSGIGLYGESIDTDAETVDVNLHLLDNPQETHGIHVIPIRGSTQAYSIDLEDAKFVYPFEPGEEVLQLDVSPTGEHLLLYSKMDKDIYLSVIDKSSMECLQKTLLMKEGKQIYGVIHGKDFMLAIDMYRNFVLMKSSGDTYEEQFRGNLGDLPYYPNVCTADFDGERLAFAACVRYDEYGSDIPSHYTLQVFTKDGRLYSGAYESSLTKTDKNPGIVLSHTGSPIEISFDGFDN